MGTHIDNDYLESIRELVVEEYVYGISPSEIAKHYRISRSTLYHLIRKAGVLRTRPGNRKLGKNAELEIIGLYNDGLSVKIIAEKMKVNTGIIYNILNENGKVMPNHQDRADRKISEEQETELVSLYENKEMNVVELGEKYGISGNIVYRILKRNGVERNHFTGPKLHFKKYVSESGRLCRFKSDWESKYAEYLDDNGIEWAYESHTYLLSDGTAYTPDFWIPSWNLLVEIKGLLTDEARIKIELFRKEYPDIKLLLVDRKTFSLYGINLQKSKIA